MAFALAATARRGAIEFLHAFVERVDLTRGRKIAARAGGPSAFVQPTENEMRPRLVLGLRRREQLDATVWMFAEKIPRDVAANSKLVQPLEKEGSAKHGLDLRRPRRVLRNFAPTFLPIQKRGKHLPDPKEFRERASIWQEDDIFQSGRNASVAFAGACRSD